MAIKHVGRLKTNKRKVIVAYRTLPNEPETALIVSTENLMDSDHDILMQMVESPTGQNAYELAQAMARTTMSDGSVMLSKFHTQGKLTRVPTSDVIMTPDSNTNIPLDELNKIIAEQKGVSIADLALTEDGQEPTGATTPTAKATTPSNEPEAAPATEGVLSDEDLAAQYRSQADAMFKEAKRLREQAEELVPSKKKTAKA